MDAAIANYMNCGCTYDEAISLYLQNQSSHDTPHQNPAANISTNSKKKKFHSVEDLDGDSSDDDIDINRNINTNTNTNKNKNEYKLNSPYNKHNPWTRDTYQHKLL
eukprot:34130_1